MSHIADMRRVPLMARRIVHHYAAAAWWLRLWPPFLVAASLWFLSSRPGTVGPVSMVWNFVHNSAHVVAYAGLGASILLAFPENVRRRGCVPAVLMSSAYGLVDEWHQSHVPGRVASLADVVSDAIGATLAVCALAWLLWRSERGLRALPWMALAALVSVSSATWLPW